VPLFSRIDPAISVDLLLPDGAPAFRKIGDLPAAGADSRYSGRRTACTQPSSAAFGHSIPHFAVCVRDCPAKGCLLDTRKTTPGLRVFEKLAVKHGGGMNHRFGLFDMMLIKDTHVKRCGGVKPALEKALCARGAAPLPKIEIEVQTTGEFDEAVVLRPDRIMLDNMSLDDMRRCVMRACGLSIEIEASGNITLETIGKVAETGVDFISCGALTTVQRRWIFIWLSCDDSIDILVNRSPGMPVYGGL